MKKALMTLAFGTFGLGVTEYVMMGILPFMAADFGVSISEAGHLISSYALGVCVGAPMMVAFMRTWPLKRIAITLMCVYIAASVAMTFCSEYYSMLAMRFVAGLPHGAYFGVGSIIADRLAGGRKAATAVAIMCSGMTVANLIGIPFGTFICQVASWRYIFGFSSIWGLVTLLFICRFIPTMEAIPDIGIKGQFRFLKSLAPWLMIGATLLGNGGVFCYFSYYAPLLTDYSGIAAALLPAMSVIAGAGMVVGNMTGGTLSDKMGPGHTGKLLEIIMFCSLLGIFFLSHIAWISVALMFITTFCLFGVSAPQQLLLLRFSKGGDLLAGCMVQLAFNLGNAIGAYLGGIPLTAGQTYNYTALPGFLMAAGGIICYVIFCHRYERLAKTQGK
ncbi:MAG: MFS transporter [Bacteroidaceae bacterium]|jgi:DHA1 family arabinose polymer transporter-like MFS transporter|nr:MFS transporter [Bacteroidaceae bacterium]